MSQDSKGSSYSCKPVTANQCSVTMKDTRHLQIMSAHWIMYSHIKAGIRIKKRMSQHICYLTRICLVSGCMD